MQMVPTVLIALIAAGLFALEQLFPLRRERGALLGRLAVNFAISVFTFLAALTLVQPAAHRALHWAAEKPLGLVHIIKMAPAVRFILSFLLVDLSFYYWHLANHRVPFLWRFHNVHHIDPDLDVSSAIRLHFGEIALSPAMSVLPVSDIVSSSGALF